MRNNAWLAQRLASIQTQFFSDVPVQNIILVRFGRASKSRFGSIIAKPHRDYRQPVTYITINSLFKDEEVPEYVIDVTLAHEYVHYSHGFHSPLRRLYKYPHQGGIVNKELRSRGIGELLALQTQWTKQHYRDFLRKHHLL